MMLPAPCGRFIRAAAGGVQIEPVAALGQNAAA